MDDRYFGEGSAYYKDANGNGRLIVLSWRERTGFIYGTRRLRKLRQFEYETTSPNHEGWGITYDESRREFIVSDGSMYLYFWDRDTLAVKRKVTVTQLNGNVQDSLNELAYVGGLICCNIWYSDTIICVNPTTGKSVREYGKISTACSIAIRDAPFLFSGADE
jgi:glutamine cyclotransferase